MHLYKCMSPINRNECNVDKCATDLPSQLLLGSTSLPEESISTNVCESRDYQFPGMGRFT